MKLLLLSLIFLPIVSTAQSVLFKEIDLTEKLNSSVDTTTIRYPILVLRNKVAADKMNAIVRERVFSFEENDRQNPQRRF